MVKILMRADTHVSFSIPAEEPKAKCTNSQANFQLLFYLIFFIKSNKFYCRISIQKTVYWFQILAAIAVSMGSMVVGFSSAYTSPALVSMRDTNITSFEVTEQEVSNKKK